MSVQLRTGPSTDIWTVDPTSLAGRAALYDASGNVIRVRSSAQVSARTAPLIYRYVLVDVAGQASAYNWLVLSNPSGSTKNIALLSAEVQIYGVTNAATKNSTTLFQATAASTAGGSDDSTNISRLLSSQTAATGTIRITNPTVSVGKAIKAFAAGGNIDATGNYSVPGAGYRPEQEDYQFIAQANEGFVFRQTVTGDVDQTYCISVEWAEYTP